MARSPFLPIAATSARDFAERFAQLLLGLFAYGIALAMMIRGGIGLAPWDVLSIGITHHLPVGYGTVTVLVSIVVLILWLPLRQRLGLGTVLNAFLVGPSADVGLWLLPPMPNWWSGGLLFAGGLVLLAAATGAYIAAGFGPGPRDGLMTGVVRLTRWPVWIVRTLIEGSVLLIGWLLGGPVGVGTVAFAFGVGPLIGLCLPRMEAWRKRRSAALAATSTTPAVSAAAEG